MKMTSAETEAYERRYVDWLYAKAERRAEVVKRHAEAVKRRAEAEAIIRSIEDPLPDNDDEVPF
jgi:hypothetical protein